LKCESSYHTLFYFIVVGIKIRVKRILKYYNRFCLLYTKKNCFKCFFTKPNFYKDHILNSTYVIRQFTERPQKNLTYWKSYRMQIRLCRNLKLTSVNNETLIDVLNDPGHRWCLPLLLDATRFANGHKGIVLRCCAFGVQPAFCIQYDAEEHSRVSIYA
jgi:hypothetical protein